MASKSAALGLLFLNLILYVVFTMVAGWAINYGIEETKKKGNLDRIAWPLFIVSGIAYGHFLHLCLSGFEPLRWHLTTEPVHMEALTSNVRQLNPRKLALNYMGFRQNIILLYPTSKRKIHGSIHELDAQLAYEELKLSSINVHTRAGFLSILPDGSVESPLRVSYMHLAGFTVPVRMFPIIFPIGNMATGFLVIFSLVAGVVGIAASLTGIHCVTRWDVPNLSSAAAASLITWSLTLLSMGVACKEISMGWRQPRLRALETLAIILAGTQLLCTGAVHASLGSATSMRASYTASL